MEVISARTFRTNQTAILNKALKGESVLLTSRLGTFRIVPVYEEESLTDRICEGLYDVRGILDGKIKAKTATEFLDEL